ncbi:MAG: polyphosphate kinase 2, partial [Actinobacteria bacterium]|nr:polyphosphate kinase 2 [Actinomycetota bacterium]
MQFEPIDPEHLEGDLDDPYLPDFVRELIEQGYTVGDTETPDPVLIDPEGREVDTWRENYPYSERMTRDEYEREKYNLQVELLKLQYWAQDAGTKLMILFEGRDAAGKGGTIKRFTEHLNPRAVRVVALTKPSSTEQGQWYFQRYIQNFPTTGEIV